jgi:hypothetical protein
VGYTRQSEIARRHGTEHKRRQDHATPEADAFLRDHGAFDVLDGKARLQSRPGNFGDDEVNKVYDALPQEQRREINQRCKQARIAHGGRYLDWLKKFLIEAGLLEATA